MSPMTMKITTSTRMSRTIGERVDTAAFPPYR
jgi:hypothetical protein